ncbi:cationic amino acid transporter 2-like [Montipora capricornis]|uniref:cationic amino acid transporter 2-like n=1 Tax=Montipora capricornis TaxID=246305 RepID=UPI0035F20EEA
MDAAIRGFTRRKFVDPSTLTSTQLNRCLSVFDLTALGVGGTLGAGIYVLAGDVARNDTGPSIVIAFTIAAVASILSGLCYAEFGARVPKAGSAYVYSYVTIGELCAFVIGWNLILEYVIGTSSVARAWSSYFDSMFDDRIKNFTISTIGEIHVTGIAEYLDFLSVLVVALLTGVLIIGIKKTSLFNSVFTGINLFVILFVVGVGACYAEPKNWTDNFMPFGFSGVMSGAATCFYAFVGFDVIATTGEEAKNPSRGIPISIVLSLGICFLAYFAVSGVLTLMWPYSTLPEGGTLPKVFALRGAPWAKYVIAIGALCGLTSSLLGALLPLPRMLYSMGSDGLIFKFLAKVNPRTEIPTIATVVSGVFSALLAFIFNLHDLVEMMSIGTLLAYTMVALCVLILRYKPGTIGLVKEGRSDDSLNSFPNGKEEETSSQDIPLLGVRRLPRQPSRATASLALTAIIASSIGFTALSALIIWGSHYLSLAKWWAILLLTVICLSLIGCILLLLRLPQNMTPLPFRVPFVPVLPLISVFINVFLILKLSYLTWIRFAVWMVIGMSIYLFYGLRNSVEGQRQARDI